MSSTGHWRTTRPKVPCTAMYTNPGPKYNVPSGMAAASTNQDKNFTLYQSPAYTIGTYWPKNLSDTPGPGPAGYKQDTKFTHKGKQGGPYGFATGKPRDPKPHATPGPHDYDVGHPKMWSKLKNAPAASMGSRNKGPQMGGGGPGPSAYTIGKKQVDFLTSRAPEHVMAAKWSDKSKDNFPGPGSYNTTPSYRYKKGTPPSYSMGGRWPDLAAKAKTPSPLAYDVKPGIKRTLKHFPEFSFGAHHSDFSHTVKTKEDFDGDCLVCDKDDYCRDTAPPPAYVCPPVKCAWT